jgi:hypothetical protein
MQCPDDSLFIHSFAHGGAYYELKFDARAIEAALLAAPVENAAPLFVRLVLMADVDPAETERLRDLVSERAKNRKTRSRPYT